MLYDNSCNGKLGCRILRLCTRNAQRRDHHERYSDRFTQPPPEPSPVPAGRPVPPPEPADSTSALWLVTGTDLGLRAMVFQVLGVQNTWLQP